MHASSEICSDMEFSYERFCSWHTCLRENHYKGSENSAHDICLFLLRNDFERPEHLRNAPPPQEWAGADEMPQGTSSCIIGFVHRHIHGRLQAI
jgi:hypothetical protein